MTDRINSITIVLEQDLRSDDAEPLLGAFRQFRGVVSVTANVSDSMQHVANERARHELGSKLLNVIYPKKP